MRQQIHRAWQLLVMTLREIFDENAYARFLAREGIASSRCAYAAFQREREAAVEKRPRCC
jgi:hypothetical protein